MLVGNSYFNVVSYSGASKALIKTLLAFTYTSSTRLLGLFVEGNSFM